MRKILLLSLLLCGCSTTQYVPVMPDVPESLKTPCQELDQIDSNASTKDAVKVIVENYSKYHECSDRVTSWNDWYSKQKEKIGNNKVK